MTTTDVENRTTTERDDLIAMLEHARFFLRFTTRDLTDDQARLHTTPSAFCLGDLVKHVTEVERGWSEFLVVGADALRTNGKDFADWTEDDYAERDRSFRMGPDESLADVLADYERVATQTNAIVREVASLDTVHELPKAPWDMDEAWSVRRAILHIAAETAQHAGHADIIRESLDGAKSMG
ncbi:DinB family protein [Rhodococcus sp. HNM0569]|uniref:DinB family protein n=1 Tax=Rhodococcus sp. HNM0569 TaxID=2716340 RepID=UPI00146DEF6B|nr:DinB family protein [Rhodococcus sp. HNM0569]NLU83194.1 DinB family protein [Rhodococcus sp. HNM0569]